MSTELSGRVALITGGARGIGKGIAQAFAEAGARVMIADIAEASGQWAYALSTADNLQEAAKALSVSGEVSSTRVDVTDAASCLQAVEATIDAFGGLDILVNNAGVIDVGPVHEFSEASWQRIFDVNTKGIFLMTKAALPALKASENAAIVNIASIAGKKGHPGLSAYCGSKFAAIGITQSLALELAADKIRVNALCPGLVGTQMWDFLVPETGQGANEVNGANMIEAIPLGALQTPEDMGEAAVYLAKAPNVTGIALTVAGGFEVH